jgi:hypothetical protein
MKTSLFFIILCWCEVFLVSAWPWNKRSSIEPLDPQCFNQPFSITWKGFQVPYIYQKFQRINDNDRGAWIDPSLVEVVFHPTLQFVGVVFPKPLLPTENKTMLGIYRQAMDALEDYESRSDADRAQDEQEYIHNRNCWKVRLACRQSPFPLYAGCESDAQGAAMHDFLSEKSVEHDLMTVHLMARSHRMALVDLGRTLVSLVNQIGDREKEKHGEDNVDDEELDKRLKILEKRVEPLTPHDGRESLVITPVPLPDEPYPTWIIKNPDMVRFFEDPVHFAQYKEVFDPHLPGYPALPSPLLPAPTDELRALYKKALHYYEEDQKLSDVWKRRREARRQVNALTWLKGHPCFCQFSLCPDVDIKLKSVLDYGWMNGQEGLRVKMVMHAELLGLIDLGERLTVEMNGGQAPF